MITEASNLNTPALDYGGNYTQDKVQSNIEWFDSVEETWRKLDHQTHLDLRSREANELLARPWEENASSYAEVREYMRQQSEAHD